MGGRLALAVVLATGCFGASGDDDDDDAPAIDAGAAPDAGGEDDPAGLGQPVEIVQTGDVIDGYTIDQLWAWVLLHDGSVQYVALVRDGDGNYVGSGLFRWAPDSHAVVLGPDEMTAAFGASASYAWLDAYGGAWLEANGCLGAYRGAPVLATCEPGYVRLVGQGRIVREVGDRTYEIYDQTGARTEILRNVAHNGGGVMDYVFDVRTAVVGRDGSLVMQAVGDGVSLSDAASILSGAGGALVPRVELEWGYQGVDWTVNGTYPGPVPPAASDPRGPRFPVVNAADDLAFVWSVREFAQPMQLSPGAGIYSTDAAGAGFRLHVDLTANLPGADAPVQFDTFYEPRLLYSLTGERSVILAATLADGRTGLWREDGGDLELIALPGQPAVDAAGRPIDGVTIAELGSFVGSDTGAVMFAARVEGAGVTADDRYRVYGVTALGATRTSELARHGESWVDGAGQVDGIRLDAFSVPDFRAGGPLALYPAIEDSRIASGSDGIGRTVDGDGCGAALMVVTRSAAQRLVKRVIDPQCKNTNRVNSTGDADDAAPGDGACNTGASVGGRPECTLRAALTETNARAGHEVIEFALPGAGPHTIAVADELPHVADSVLILPKERVIVDGGGLVANGLTVTADGVTLVGLTVQGFGGHGIESRAAGAVQLHAFSSLDNCGWGVWSTGAVRFRAGDERSVVAGNGAGAGCEGGGLLVATDDVNADFSVWLERVDVRDNNGPGVLANAEVRADDVVVANNAGDGIVVSSMDDGALRFRLSSSTGNVAVTGNRGHGLALEGGGVFMPHTALTATDNGGWGVWLDGGQARLGRFSGISRTTPHDLSRNGTGAGCVHWAVEDGPTPVATPAPCGGGGVAILHWTPEPTDTSSLIDLATIADNEGPGVLSTDELTAWRLTVTGNRGPGIATLVGDEPPQNYAVRLTFGPTLIAGNLGDGVRVEHGGVLGEQALIVQDNAGWGVRSDAGSVRLPELGTPTSWQTHVTGNGTGATCYAWSLDAMGYPTSVAQPCAGGGVSTGDGDVDGIELFVVSNAGPGIEGRSATGAFGTGAIDLTLGQVCGNSGGDTVADGAVTLTSVDTSCP